MAKSILQYDQMQKEKKIPMFRLADVHIEALTNYGELNFTLINMGDSIKIENWMLEIQKIDGKLLCRYILPPIVTSEGGSIENITFNVYVVNRNLSYENIVYYAVLGAEQNETYALAPGDVAFVNIVMTDNCPAKIYDVGLNVEKIIVRLLIPPSGYSVILRCKYDLSEGEVICTE